MALGVQAELPAQRAAEGGKTDICIKLRRDSTLASISWPVAQAGAYALRMRELLR